MPWKVQTGYISPMTLQFDITPCHRKSISVTLHIIQQCYNLACCKSIPVTFHIIQHYNPTVYPVTKKKYIPEPFCCFSLRATFSSCLRSRPGQAQIRTSIARLPRTTFSSSSVKTMWMGRLLGPPTHDPKHMNCKATQHHIFLLYYCHKFWFSRLRIT